MTTRADGPGSLAAILILLMLAVSCSVSTETTTPVVVEQTSGPRSAEELLALADLSNRPQAVRYRLDAAEQFIEEQRFDQAAAALATVPDPENLPGSLRARLALANAEVALAMEAPEQALVILDSARFAGAGQQSTAARRRLDDLRARALMATGRFTDALLLLVEISSSPGGSQQHRDMIWRSLQYIPEQELVRLSEEVATYELLGWIDLARSLNSRQYSIPSQLEAIARWQDVWSRHSALARLPSQLRELQETWNRRPRHIALLLPLQNQIGRAVQEGFFSAYYQAMAIDTDVPEVSVFDTSNVTRIRDIYETAVDTGADLIIGPLDKDLVNQLGALRSLPVPTLALNYMDSPTRNSSVFYQFGLAPEDEINHTAELAWRAGYRNAAIVSPESVNYQRLLQKFVDTWEILGGNVTSTVSYSGDGEYAESVRQLLAINDSEDRAARLEALLPRDAIEFTPTRRGDIDFIFLMANPRQGRQIKPSLAFYFAEDIPVYALSAINDGSSNQLVNQDLNGVIFTDTPWVLEQDPLKQEINATLQSTQGPLQRLRALGVDGFRLYARLEQLANNELTGFRGATGLLSMNGNGAIKRIPRTATFVDGVAVALEDTGSLALN